MKKSIFTLGLIASSFTLINASETIKVQPEIHTNIIELINDDNVIYLYSVETEDGVFNGTVDTMAGAKNMVAKLDSNYVINKSITPIAIDIETQDKVYVWGVSTNYGYASGTSDSITEANKMVAIMSQGDVTETKTIESFKTTK